MEDVHRAGGIMVILGELARGGLLHQDACSLPICTLRQAIAAWDVNSGHAEREVQDFYRAAPGGVRTKEAFSQDRYYAELDLDREQGCIRDRAHAYSQDGGLAVLYGNLAPNGCIVKTAGVDESILRIGRAHV